MRALEHGAARIVVDLTSVSFVDSSTVAVFVRVLRCLRPSGGRLFLAGATPFVLRIFGLAGVERLFELFPSRDAALSAAGLAMRETVPA